MVSLLYIWGMKWLITVIGICTLLSGCVDAPPPKVQVLGQRLVEKHTVNGRVAYDTVTAVIPAFQFLDQDSNVIDTNTVQGKIYVVDFFFTHCPSICPKMKAEMHKVYIKYKDNKDVLILSHSIDPARDSISVLKRYAEKLDLNSDKWHFLTGNKDSIYAIADHYLESAKEDKDAAGGFIHDGNFILVDRQRRIRGYYDGTTDDGTDKLLADIEALLHEK